MTYDQSVDDFSGVCLGRTSEGGEVYNHSGVRIGTLDADGYVVDYSHVRFGRARSGNRRGVEEKKAGKPELVTR